MRFFGILAFIIIACPILFWLLYKKKLEKTRLGVILNDNKSSVISVVGNGYIETEPDELRMEIAVFKIAKTINQSRDEVDQIIRDIRIILKNNKIPAWRIYTTPMEFNPNFTWEKNDKTYRGQKTEQNIICIIRKLEKNIHKAVNILDKLKNNPDSIRFNLQFGNKKIDKIKKKCRKFAYRDGRGKAAEYAKLGGIKIVKVSKISEIRPGPSQGSNPQTDTKKIETILYSSLDEQNKLPLEKIIMQTRLYIDFIAG